MPPVSRLIPVVLVSALAVAAGGAAAAGLGSSDAGSTNAQPNAQPNAKPIAKTRCSEFPANNWWHAEVRALPVHPRSAAWLSNMSTERDLHPDFGPSYGDGPNYGIPITVVNKRHRKVKVRFVYRSESDRVKYPLGKDTRIEGGRASDGDRHAIIVDKSRCKLFELYDLLKRKGTWRAGSGAVWSLKRNKLRPDGWTSADAAGLPILPGLLRWNEVKSNRIDHAIRFTTDVTSRHHLWPARHDAGSTNDMNFPPMGARFRLKASYDASGLSPYAQRVVTAMQTYGLVLADNGSPWFFQGEQHRKWPERLIEDLKTIPASAFVAVDTGSLQVSADSAKAK